MRATWEFTISSRKMFTAWIVSSNPPPSRKTTLGIDLCIFEAQDRVHAELRK